MWRCTLRWALLVWFGLLGLESSSHGQSPAEYAQTAAFAAAHQNKDGGFASKVGESSSLGATNSALRVLKHVGGSVPDILGCIAYVKSCRDGSGGFAPAPAGKPDVITTAIGLMAASELKIADEATIKAATVYFGKNAKSFEETRMAIAGLEAVKAKSPDFPAWLDRLQAMRSPDGTFGEGPGQAYATGGAAAAILRMGLELDRRDAVIAAIKAGQRPEGGWSKDAGPPDLGATYRIMRRLYMLQEKPDVERLLGFIARCRQSDGSYASTPGGHGELGATYTATIVIYWLRLLTRHADSGRDRRLHAARSTATAWPAGKETASSGPCATACSSATRRASITTSSCLRHSPTATSSCGSASGCSRARATAACSSGACACRRTRCRVIRPTSARATGARSTTNRGATRCWWPPRPTPSKHSTRPTGTVTSCVRGATRSRSR